MSNESNIKKHVETRIRSARAIRQPSSWFTPADAQEHARANAGHDVTDYCRNCGFAFMEHTNGACPPKEVS